MAVTNHKGHSETQRDLFCFGEKIKNNKDECGLFGGDWGETNIDGFL